MKNIASFLALAVFLALNGSLAAEAQKRFDVKPFGLMSSQGTAKLSLGQSQEEAVKALGPPSQMDMVFSEVNRRKLVVYYYNANKLYFLDDVFVTFELHDNTLVFGKSIEEAFSVGAKIIVDGKVTTTEGHYLVNNTPLDDLKVNNKPGKCANIQYNRIASSYTKYGDVKTDGLFQMLFDSNNKVIYIALRN